MAMFGIGSKWGADRTREEKEKFFDEEKVYIGWDYKNANDLYSLFGSIKVGDIIFIKSNQPGSRKINIKGIGIIKKSFINCLLDGEYNNNSITDFESIFIKVKWLSKKTFSIEIPENSGKLTNIRSATIYEEIHPYVQEKIIENIQ